MIRRTFCMLALGLTALAAVPSLSLAQDRQRGQGGGGDFREQMMNRMKEQLGASADEWTVIQPKIEKVMNAQREQMAGRFGGFGGRSRGGDRGGDNNNNADRNRGGSESSSALATASKELRETLDNKDAAADQIVAKLKALREARAKVKADLETAQKDLQGVLSPRQEAVMVSMGMLE